MSDSEKEINNTLNEVIVPSFSNDTESNKEQNVKKRKIGLPIIVLAICLFLVLIIGGFSAVLLKRNADVEKVKQARNDAYQKFKQGNYIAAKEAAKKGLSISGDPYLLRTYIDASSAQGNLTGKEVDVFKKTQPLLSKLEEVDGKNAESLMSIGYAYEIAGKYEKALSYYERALVVDPKSGIAYFHKGHVLAFINRDDESKIAYEKAYELDPENPQVLIVKANALRQKGDSNVAIKQLIKVGEDTKLVNELRAEAYTAIAIINSNADDITNAVKYSKLATEISDSYSPGLALYGFLRSKNGENYAEGINYIAKAIKQNSNISHNYLLLGIVLRTQNELEKAIQIQKAGIKKTFSDNTLVGNVAKKQERAKMYYELAQTYSLIPDAQNAIENLEFAISDEPLYSKELKNDMILGYFFAIKNDNTFIKFLNTK